MLNVQRRWLLILIALSLVTLNAALFRVWIFQKKIHYGYEISTEQHQGSELRRHLKELQIESAALHAPGHLTKRARELGLREPRADERIGIAFDEER